MIDYNAVEFADNLEPRCPCILLLDVSYSMAGDRIEELNAGLQIFKENLMQDDLASLRVEIAIVTFGGDTKTGVKVKQDFITADQFSPPVLSATGGTPMGVAINLALDKIQERKSIYRQTGVPYYRPWIFMITDGEPTDEWQSAARRVKEAEERKSVAFFCVGVMEANIEKLARISTRQPIKLKGLNFREMFVWLSQSLTSVSHSVVGEQVPLESPVGPKGWGAID